MTTKGHNSKVKAGPVNPKEIKSYVDRVKALVTEQKAIGADITDVCKSAKDAGLDPTTIRFAAREALMDAAKRAERDDRRDHYLHALGLAVAAVESGEMSARQSAREYGVGKSSIYKALAVRDVSTARAEVPAPNVWHTITAPVLEELAAAEAVRLEKEAERERKRAERSALAERNGIIDADPLDIPPFLRASGSSLSSRGEG